MRLGFASFGLLAGMKVWAEPAVTTGCKKLK